MSAILSKERLINYIIQLLPVNLASIVTGNQQSLFSCTVIRYVDKQPVGDINVTTSKSACAPVKSKPPISSLVAAS